MEENGDCLRLLSEDGLILYGESEKNLKMMIGRSVEICKRRGSESEYR